MLDKDVFIQELYKKYTLLQQVELIEDYVIQLIENDSITKSEIVSIKESLENIVVMLRQNDDSINTLNHRVDYIENIINNLNQIIKDNVDEEIGVALVGEY